MPKEGDITINETDMALHLFVAFLASANITTIIMLTTYLYTVINNP